MKLKPLAVLGLLLLVSLSIATLLAYFTRWQMAFRRGNSTTGISTFSEKQRMASAFIYQMGLLVAPTSTVAARVVAGRSQIEARP